MSVTFCEKRVEKSSNVNYTKYIEINFIIPFSHHIVVEYRE